MVYVIHWIQAHLGAIWLIGAATVFVFGLILTGVFQPEADLQEEVPGTVTVVAGTPHSGKTSVCRYVAERSKISPSVYFGIDPLSLKKATHLNPSNWEEVLRTCSNRVSGIFRHDSITAVFDDWQFLDPADTVHLVSRIRAEVAEFRKLRDLLVANQDTALVSWHTHFRKEMPRGVAHCVDNIIEVAKLNENTFELNVVKSKNGAEYTTVKAQFSPRWGLVDVKKEKPVRSIWERLD